MYEWSDLQNNKQTNRLKFTTERTIDWSNNRGRQQQTPDARRDKRTVRLTSTTEHTLQDSKRDIRKRHDTLTKHTTAKACTTYKPASERSSA